MRFTAATTAAASLALASVAGAELINLTPADINGGDTTTTQFSNADLTLTPFVGGVQDTFNANAVRLGIDDNGTNDAAFSDAPGTDADETLVFDFADMAGLTQISYDFSRAQGPLETDGVTISGFLFDPNASLTGPDESTYDQSTINYDVATGTLQLLIPGGDFGNPDVTLQLGSAAASAGQTLTLSVQDSVQAGAQFAILGIQYDNNVTSIPEPTSAALLALAGIPMLSRRRRA